MNSWTPAAGDVIAERFRLERELGRGGMGSVWRAHHLSLDVPCAVKFVLDQAALAGDARSRFQREARAAARLRSRNVVQILDHGVWRERPYIAMELLDGESLAHRLERRRRLTAQETLAVLGGAARALAASAHLGIVHRDLKPENVFIALEGREEYAKVLDFGIAKVQQEKLAHVDHRTQTGALLGTPHYMSPEQVDGTLPVDHRSDLWSLSVIAYECLTGRLPFDSEALGNLFMKIMSGPVPVPSHVAPDLPTAFDAWWLRAASRDPERRFQSSDAWYHALEAALLRSEAPGDAAAEPTELASLMKTTPTPMEVPEALRTLIAPPEIPELGAQAWHAQTPPVGGARMGTLQGQTLATRPRRATIGIAAGVVALLLAGAGVAAFVGRDAATPAAGETAAAQPTASAREPQPSAAPTAATPTAPAPSAVATAEPTATATTPPITGGPPPPRRPPRTGGPLGKGKGGLSNKEAGY
jgi:serine/threonine-protein kinase